jgi:uncharacterized protein
VILLDANLLLYAYDSSSIHHNKARAWLYRAITTQNAVRLSWTTILAFLRISTNYRAVESPFSEAEACEVISELMKQPSVAVLSPGPKHWSILAQLIQESGCKGPLIMDAHLAALAIEHGAILCTHDRDFARFNGVRVEYPLAGA